MSTFRPALHPNWDLRIEGQRARIHRRHDGQPVSALAAVEAILVGLMDGHRTEPTLKEDLVAIVGEAAQSWVPQTLLRLRPLLADGLARSIGLDLRVLAKVAGPDPTDGIRLLPGPRVLHWHVTNYCPRRCVYCYAAPIHGGHALDASISRGRLRAIFTEAVSLGATTLLVSGAEPLLRVDLPEVLGDAVTAGLSLLLTTKHPISFEMAQRFARSGVPHLSLSIDSLDPEENNLLIGSRQFARQMERSMEALRTAGVAFSVQTVVTRLNRTGPLDVATLAEIQGARVMQLVPFKHVHQPLTTIGNQELALKDDGEVDTLAREIQRRHPALQVERFREATETGAFHCDIGQTKLFFLPDGVVHRCYKLVHDNRLRGHDLKTTSVAAAWHDPDFHQLVAPSREQYAKSACHSCAKFGACHTSGRCIYDAWVNHGKYTAPDRPCEGRNATI